MPHSGLQSTIQLALHFGAADATPDFLQNGWKKLFFRFDGMDRARLMNTLSAYCCCAVYYSRYRCTFLLSTLICHRIILTRFTNIASLHSSAPSGIVYRRRYMELLCIIGIALFLILCWLVFLIGPIYLCIISACRAAAWWHPQDKNPSYIEIKFPRLARLLIPRYSGDSSCLRTNIPIFYDRFVWNEYPNRLSRVGAICYGLATIPTFFYAYQISSYFFAGNFDNDMVPVSLGLLVISSIGISIIARLN